MFYKKLYFYLNFKNSISLIKRIRHTLKKYWDGIDNTMIWSRFYGLKFSKKGQNQLKKKNKLELIYSGVK